MARKRKPKERDPLTDASSPRLRYAIIVSDADVRVFKSGQVSMSPAELRAMNGGDLMVFPSWEGFCEECTIKQIASLAERFDVAIPAKSRNKTDASLLVWHRLCDVGKAPALTGQGSVRPGERRTGKLANRRYVKVRDEDLSDAERGTRTEARRSLCPQARACLEIFEAAGVDEVPESRMRGLIEENQDRLKTRQDPWRIWQYYRPTLIRERFLRLV